MLRLGIAAVYRDANLLPKYKIKLRHEFGLPTTNSNPTPTQVLVLDAFNAGRHERLLKEIIGLQHFARIIIVLCSSDGQNSRPMVIDWPDACCGDPTADVCRSYLLLKLHAEDIAEPYLDAYCSISNMPRAKIFDWLPYVAAARLAEDVPDDRTRLLEIVHA